MATTKKTGTNEDRESTFSRRRFIQGVMATSAAAGVTGLSADAITALSTDEATTVFTGEQSRTLKSVLNSLIPAEGAMPAAGDLGIAAFVERAAATSSHLRRHIITMLTALPDAHAPRQLSDEELHQRLERVEHEQHDSFDILLQVTYAGYYGHPQVQAALGWVDFEEPQFPLDRFDAALLDRVRARGPL